MMQAANDHRIFSPRVASDAPIRTALIGFGRAGQLQHAPQLDASTKFELTAIVTNSPERIRLARSRYPATRILASTAELWENARDFDLVIVASPNDTHVPLARLALSHNLAVVVDKPLAADARSARHLVEETEGLDIPFSVYLNRRWDGDFQTVKQLVEAGALGDVFDFESRFCWWDPEPEQTWKTEASWQQGGGALFDLGPHLIDQAIQLFGPVIDFRAELDRRRTGSGADDNSFVAMTHVSGVRSRLWMSCVAAQMGPRFRVSGSSAAFTKLGLDPQEEQAEAGLSPADAQFGEDSRDRWGVIGTDGATRAVPTVRGNYDAYYEGMSNALRGLAPVPVEPRDGVQAMDLIEAMIADSQSRQGVDDVNGIRMVTQV